MSALAEVLAWLESSSAAVSMRQSQWLYPCIEIVHITGIVLVAGAAILFDIRLLGFSKNQPVTLLAHHLLRWSKRGLWLVIPSGILLFITNASTLGYQKVFWLKMILLLSAGLNAYIFHRIIFRTAAHWDAHKAAPTGAQAAAVFSIILWVAVIACGRLLAYV